MIFVTDIARDLRDADWLDHLARMTTRRIDLRRREMFQRDENVVQIGEKINTAFENIRLEHFVVLFVFLFENILLEG